MRFDTGARALYSTDASNYRQVPIGVVVPRHAGDIIETVALCREYGRPCCRAAAAPASPGNAATSRW